MSRGWSVLVLIALSLAVVVPSPSRAANKNVNAPEEGTFYIDRFALGTNRNAPLVVVREKNHLNVKPVQSSPVDGLVTTNPTIPPGYFVTGVRVCYSLTKPGPGPGDFNPSEITRLRLAQFDETTGSYALQFEDNVAGTGPGGFFQMVCIDSQDVGRIGSLLTCLDPFVAPIEVSLRVNLAEDPAQVLIHALGVHYSLNCTPTFSGAP